MKDILRKRLEVIVDLSYKILCGKIEHGNIKIDNEAGLQLQFGYILKCIGQLYEFRKDERFSIFLETGIILDDNSNKSGTKKARCDIELHLEDSDIKTKCAIELKYFKKENHREPNNRYDYFLDLSNIEKYKINGFDVCYMIVGTDHLHYVNQDKYSDDTSDFDFRNNTKYTKNTIMIYKTEQPYGKPLELNNDYHFKWDINKNYHFMKNKL